MLPATEHIAPCFPYRCWANPACQTSGCDLSCAHQLERTIRQLGPENVAAFIAEPVVGATLGALPATPGYFQEIRAICDRYDVLFIADEVMTGFGRTGEKFGIDHWGVVPDLIACAKGIGGGYAPLGAVIVKPEIVGEVRRTSGTFLVGHTAAGNPLSAATGLAVLRYVLDHDLIGNAAAVGPYFKERLQELAGTPPDDRRRPRSRPDARGRTRRRPRDETPLPAGLEGEPSWSGGRRSTAASSPTRSLGTVDGMEGDHLLYTPPLIITRAQVDELVAILDDSLAAVAATLREAAASAPSAGDAQW